MRPNQSTGPASKAHVFPGVTLQALMSLRDQGDLGGQAGGSYKLALDPDGIGGLLTINVGVGDVVLRFSHNNERAELTLTIVKKPMLLPSAMIWTGASQVLRNAINKAGSSAS